MAEVESPGKDERIAFHLRGIKMSILPAALGVVAGFLSSPYMLSTAHQTLSIIILVLAIYVQKYLYTPWGLDSSKFDWKAWFYVGFMTFCFWYVTWAIIANGMPANGPQFGPFF